MKASELLRKARLAMERVSEGNAHFGICRAVDVAEERAYRDLKIHGRAACLRIVGRVMALLDGAVYLNSWLVDFGHATAADLKTPEGKAKLRATRLAWIDDLIAYFEAQGD